MKYLHLVLNQSFFSDKRVIFLLAGLTVVTFATIILQIYLIDIDEFQLVPISYSDYNPSFAEEGTWRQQLQLPAFTLIVAILNSLIAMKMHSQKREYGFFMMVAALFIGIFTAVVSWALLSLV